MFCSILVETDFDNKEIGLIGVVGLFDSLIFASALFMFLHVFKSYCLFMPAKVRVPPPMLSVFMIFFCSLDAQAGSYLI